MDDLVSILLPLYNAQFSLARCLQSILDQTYPHFEVIAVDDGSNDSSPAILSQFASLDSRINSFHLRENKGIVFALNFGLKKCQGKWVARMDADDVMHPKRLETQLDHMKQHPTIDILGSRIHLFRYRGELTPGQERYRDWSNSLVTDEDIKSNIFAESPIMHPTFFLSRETYRKLEGYRNHPWAEDYDFLLRAYLENLTFAKLTELLVEKGDHPTRLARTDSRCKRPAMFAAKAFYFVRKMSLRQNKKRIIVVGTGSAGRMTFQALKQQGLEIDGFLDNIDGGVKQTFLAKPVFTVTMDTSAELLKAHKDTLFLLCIGIEEGRVLVEKMFKQNGFKSGKDYIRFI